MGQRGTKQFFLLVGEGVCPSFPPLGIRGPKGNMGKKRVKDKSLCLWSYNFAGGQK